MIRPFFLGVSATIGLIFFYFLVMGILSRSLSATLSQFGDLKFWILSLSVVFGLQVFLYSRYRQLLGQNQRRQMLMASGAASSVSMVVCCVHHLADVLPLVGFSAFSLFLIGYQKALLALSLGVNFISVAILVKKIRSLRFDRR